MRLLATLLVFAFSATSQPAAQEQAGVRKLYETGRFAEAAEAAAADPASPHDVRYLAAQSLVRLERAGEARERYASFLSESGEDPWHAIGESGIAMLDGDFGRAAAAARRATELAPDLFYGHYQLGRAQFEGGQPAPAAEAFERAMQIDPSFAYAHYYAGMAYNKLRRPDRMSEHFRMFVRLAPEAPERQAVETILRGMRGR
jgi:tetratricopeptide (TPR) repeat protein